MSRTSHSTEDIERELAELGEAPPSDDELAWVHEPSELAKEAQVDVATTLRLVELSEPLDMPGLSELETRRVWQTIEQRRAKPKPDASTQHPAGGGARRWLFAAVGLAAAAALIVIVISPDDATLVAPRDGDAGPSAEQVAELGDKVRASLAALDDGKSDTARATELAADYERRLAASQTEREERGG